MLRTLAIVVTAVALLPSQTQSPTFRARIDLVPVDVVVVDRAGNPIRGLKVSDFSLVDRKTPQQIATFDEVSHERAPAAGPALAAAVRRDVADNQTAQSDRLVILVIDDLHIWKGRTDRAKEIAAMIVRDLGPQSSMAVLFTSGEHSTQVTADRALLSAALETLKGRQSVRRPHAASDNQRAPAADLQQFFDNMTQYKTLEDAARLLGTGDARRKAFVMVSEGIGKDLTGMFDGEATPCEAACGSCPCYHDTALRAMMEALRRSNVTSYTVDPRGHVPAAALALEAFPAPPVLPAGAGSARPADGLGDDPASGGFRWNNPIRQAQDGLKIMAEASGGFAVVDSDDFAAGLKRIIEDLDHYYLLGFYPSDPKGKGYRPLDVRVAGHPEWTVRFRRGYLPGGPPDPPKNTSPLVALSSGVLPSTDLPLRITAIVMPGSGNPRVALALEVSAPRRALESPDGKFRDRLKYEVLVVDQKKAKVRSLLGLEGELTLSRIPQTAEPPDTIEYQVGETFEIPPGRYELRVSAISTKLGKGGSVYLDLEVPDLRKAPLAVGGLLLGRAAGSRVPVAPQATRRARAPQGRAAAPPPALPFPPSLDREFTAADELRVYFEGVARSPGHLTAAIEVVDTSGKVVRSPSPSFALGDPVRVQGVVPLAGLAAGSYVLRGTLGDSVRSATNQIAFVLR